MRYSNDEYIGNKLMNGYDYVNQAWVVNGKYVRCAHPGNMKCSCYGRQHAGEYSKEVDTDMGNLFEDYRNGLTVQDLKRILEQFSDTIEICVSTLGEYFPAKTVSLGTRKLYPLGCNGIPQGTKECIKIG